MLANRSNSTIGACENETIIKDAKTKGLSNVNKNIPTKNQRRGLGLRPANIPSDTIKPSVVHSIKKSQESLISSQKNANKIPKYDEPLKRKTLKVETDQLPKIDENDESVFAKNPYEPLLDTCPFDEVLFEKVMKLELADDGLPKFDSTEPFDF